MELAQEPLDVFGAALDNRSVGLVGEVPVEDLVRTLQISLVDDLLDVAAEDVLVLLFGRHSVCPLLPMDATKLSYSEAASSASRISPSSTILYESARTTGASGMQRRYIHTRAA